MTQRVTSRPPEDDKVKGDTLFVNEFNELNSVINDNASDANPRLSSLTNDISNLSPRVDTMVDNNFTMVSYDTINLPIIANDGEVSYDTSINSIVYHQNGRWYSANDDNDISIKVALRLKIKTDIIANSANDQFLLPLISGNSYDFQIDWGDGTPLEHITSATSLTPHTFTQGPGEYILNIIGEVNGFKFDPYVVDDIILDDALKIIEILDLGNTPNYNRLKFGSSANSAFANCSNMANNSIVGPDTSNTTDFSLFYYNCSNITSIPYMDVSQGTNYSGMFKQCGKLSNIPSSLVFGKATNVTEMFSRCSDLVEFPYIDTELCESFYEFAHNCPTVREIPHYDTSSCTSFNRAFRVCGATNLPNFDTSKVTDFSFAFEIMGKLLSFPSEIDTSKGEIFEYCWSKCGELTSFPSLNVQSGTNFQGAWLSCDKLADFPILNFDSGDNFINAWQNCNLSAQSIENIFVSLVNTNKTGLVTSVSGGTNESKQNWTSLALSSYEILVANVGVPIHGTTGRGWGIQHNS